MLPAPPLRSASFIEVHRKDGGREEGGKGGVWYAPLCEWRGNKFCWTKSTWLWWAWQNVVGKLIIRTCTQARYLWSMLFATYVVVCPSPEILPTNNLDSYSNRLIWLWAAWLLDVSCVIAWREQRDNLTQHKPEVSHFLDSLTSLHSSSVHFPARAAIICWNQLILSSTSDMRCPIILGRIPRSLNSSWIPEFFPWVYSLS